MHTYLIKRRFEQTGNTLSQKFPRVYEFPVNQYLKYEGSEKSLAGKSSAKFYGGECGL